MWLIFMTFSGSLRHKLLCVSTQNFVVLEIVVLVVNKHHETSVAFSIAFLASTIMKIDLPSSGEIIHRPLEEVLAEKPLSVWILLSIVSLSCSIPGPTTYTAPYDPTRTNIDIEPVSIDDWRARLLHSDHSPRKTCCTTTGS